MKRKFLLHSLLLILFVSCGQDYNSNYNDRGTYADIGIPTGTPFYNSYLILQSKCFSCHSYSGYTTDQQWIDAGLVTRGSFDTSTLKSVLKNYGGLMPKDPISALTDAEVEVLRGWINGL
jgi:hypothetical protein